MKVYSAILLIVLLTWTTAQYYQFPCVDGEKKIARENANERDYESCSKEKKLNCRFTASYTNFDLDAFNSPDGQVCEERGAKVFTGRCKSGRCLGEEIISLIKQLTLIAPALFSNDLIIYLDLILAGSK